MDFDLRHNNICDENPDGCELAPNVEFMGRVGSRTVNGLKIVGLSGTYSQRDFNEPHPAWPYSKSVSKQVAHYNDTDLDELLDLGRPDILLTHDWPLFMLEAHRDRLPRRKDVKGSKDLVSVLEGRPARWHFCGHMHFHAEQRHNRTQVIGLAAFNYDPEDACLVLDTETGAWEWPLRNK